LDGLKLVRINSNSQSVFSARARVAETPEDRAHLQLSGWDRLGWLRPVCVFMQCNPSS